MKNNTANTYSNGCTSRAFPFANFNNGYEMNPSAIPVEILDVNGIVKMTKKAGNASSMPFQLISFTALIIKLPTIINAGDVMAETPEIDVTNGLKNEAMINSTPTVTDVKPVRPPAATPDVDSM